MKQATLQIKFDEEKLNAIKQYMGKKDADLQTELDDVMQKLYKKHVPAPVREYIESRDSRAQEKPKRPARPSSTATNNDGNTTV
ncbi:MAG: DUF6103 family protein [Clostridiales bacterium]|jgi:hypothetical protein|nr:DUF6103 family protein [Eubacteriales bacterium]MDH7567329.1 DUF6103 family protein [Clostridiales bacterium]